MDKLSDLELITAIAEIEGLKLTYSNNIGEWSCGTPYGKDDREYNPLTDRALLLDLIFKHRVSIVMNGNGDNHAFYMDKDIDIYQPDIEKFPRSILEAIIGANNG